MVAGEATMQSDLNYAAKTINDNPIIELSNRSSQVEASLCQASKPRGPDGSSHSIGCVLR